MKTSPRENLLSLYRRQGYEYAPVHLSLSPSQVERFTKETGLPGDRVDEYFGYPMRHLGGPNFAKYESVAFRTYYPADLQPGAHITPWGIALEKGSAAAMHMHRIRHPLGGDDVTMDTLLAYPWPTLVPNDSLAARVQMLKERGLASAGEASATVWERAWQIRTMEALMADMMDDDEKAAFILDKITDVSCIAAAAFAHAGIDILILGDDVGMQNSIMMSEALYRQWLKPRLIKVIKTAKEIKPDILIHYHSCGYIVPFIPDLMEAGIDILNPVQPECMSFADIHAQYGAALSFNGTLGTQTTMPFGTPDDVRQVVTENLRIAGDKGGLLVCPTHVVEPEVPWENIMAYVQACGAFTLPRHSA